MTLVCHNLRGSSDTVGVGKHIALADDPNLKEVEDRDIREGEIVSR